MDRVRTRDSGGGPTMLGASTTKASRSYITKNIPLVVDSLATNERIADEIHRNWPRSGGPLSLSRRTVSYTDAHGWHGIKRYHTNDWYSYLSFYEGRYRVLMGMPNATIPPVPSDETDITAEFGADAWNRFKPAKPDVGLAQFFAEMTSARDMMLTGLANFRGVGRNYLAVEFGWKPFLADLRSWWSSVRKIDNRIAQLQRDNSKWVRRGGTLLKNQNTITGGSTTDGKVYHTPSLGGANTRGWHYSSTVEEKVWFSAAFRYYIPGLLDQKWGRARALQELWDVKVTPELVYQLIPFSWLADWYSNLGSVIGNLQSSIDDHLVAKYAYVMRHKSINSEYRTDILLNQTTRSAGSNVDSSTAVPVTASASVKTETKSRCVADPFGFNLDLPTLSNWQTSILVALGLSRTR